MTRFFVLAVCFATSGVALGQTPTCNDFGHFDVYLDIAQRADQTPQLAVRRDNPTDSNFIFSLDAADRSLLIAADFGDFGGGPHKTDDPGWVINPGDFAANDVLWFRALDALSFYDRDSGRWLSEPPAGERVRFFGAVPPEVFINGDPEELAFYRQGTIWSGDGLAGPLESAIEQAAADGSIHSHLDFCVEDSTGDCSAPGIGQTGSPSVGAYLIELQLFSDATNGDSAPSYLDADPVKVILNNGLVADECASALEALSLRDPASPAPRTPASGILIISGE
ncbi:MAG: hypothetical protein AB8G17_18700 [Gammaproteobacteria bacterium]